MIEHKTGVPFDIGASEQFFKVLIGTGTASIQVQALDEGFDESTDGAFSATATGILHVSNCQVQVILTGDARFFMGIHNNRR